MTKPLSFLIALLAAALGAAAHAQAPGVTSGSAVFDAGFATSVSLTGTGTLWTNCPQGGSYQALSGYQAIEFQLLTNASGNAIQMQTTQDVAGALAGTATWIVNNAGQLFDGNSLPISTNAGTNRSMRWPKYDLCSRLQVTSGSGSVTGWVSASGVPISPWTQSYPAQSWTLTSNSNLSTTDTTILSAVSIRQFVFIINSSASAQLIWCQFGSSVTAGAGAFPLPNQGSSFYFSLPQAVSNQALHCMKDSGAGGTAQLTVYSN